MTKFCLSYLKQWLNIARLGIAANLLSIFPPRPA